MGIAKLYGQKASGMNINGIIKDYHAYAGENISAGDLVEYIKGIASHNDYGTSVDTQLSTTTYTGYIISAVQLDENKVFIAHRYLQSNSDYIYGMVCVIEGAKITIGIDTYISDFSYDPNVSPSNSGISAVTLDENRVFIAFGYGNDIYLRGIVCKIDGTTITPGAYLNLATNSYAGNTISTELLPNGNVFVAHSRGSGKSLFAMVCTISETTITKGTDTALSSTTSAGFAISTELLDDSRVFIAHSYSSSYHLYGVVCTISNTTITAGADTPINTAALTGYSISTVLLPNGNVFMAHSGGSSYTLYGIIVVISGNSITFGTDTAINSGVGYTGYYISTVLLSNGNVFIAHSFSSGSSTIMYLYGIVCTISETTITKSTDTLLNNSNNYVGRAISSVLLSNNLVFIAHGSDSSYYLYAQVFGIDETNNIPTKDIVINEYETQVRKTTTSQFDGVAKTSGTGGDDIGHKDLVSVYTLESA